MWTLPSGRSGRTHARASKNRICIGSSQGPKLQRQVSCEDMFGGSALASRQQFALFRKLKCFFGPVDARDIRLVLSRKGPKQPYRTKLGVFTFVLALPSHTISLTTPPVVREVEARRFSLPASASKSGGNGNVIYPLSFRFHHLDAGRGPVSSAFSRNWAGGHASHHIFTDWRQRCCVQTVFYRRLRTRASLRQ